VTVQQIVDLAEEELPGAWRRNGPCDAIADLDEEPPSSSPDT
jgi:hypothetical protein